VPEQPATVDNNHKPAMQEAEVTVPEKKQKKTRKQKGLFKQSGYVLNSGTITIFPTTANPDFVTYGFTTATPASYNGTVIPTLPDLKKALAH